MPLKLASGQVIADTDPNYNLYKAQGATVTTDPSTLPTGQQTGQGYYKPGIGTTYMGSKPNDSAFGGKTAGDIYSGITFETPEEKAFREAQANQSRDIANSTIDEATIRKNTLDRFQAEIDALNRVYAEKKRQEEITGQGRLGSVAAIQARRGLIGSDFGAAQQTGQENANLAAVNAIEAERAMREQAILSESRKLADSEIEKKTAAKKEGADAYLKYISGQADSRKANALTIAQRLYDQDAFDTSDLKAIAETLGISEATLRATYADYKKAADIAKKEAETKAKKEEAELAKTIADTKNPKTELDTTLLKEGYTYIATPAERDALKAKGYEIATVGGRTYGKPPAKKSGGTGTTEKANKNKVDQFFYSRKGPDGKVSPDDYAAAKSAWITDGGTSESFDAIFYTYKDPSNPYYN